MGDVIDLNSRRGGDDEERHRKKRGKGKKATVTPLHGPFKHTIQQAISADDLVAVMDRFNIGESDLARIVGVGKQTVRSWRRVGVSEHHEDRMVDLLADDAAELASLTAPLGPGDLDSLCDASNVSMERLARRLDITDKTLHVWRTKGVPHQRIVTIRLIARATAHHTSADTAAIREQLEQWEDAGDYTTITATTLTALCERAGTRPEYFARTMRHTITGVTQRAALTWFKTGVPAEHTTHVAHHFVLGTRPIPADQLRTRALAANIPGTYLEYNPDRTYSGYLTEVTSRWHWLLDHVTRHQVAEVEAILLTAPAELDAACTARERGHATYTTALACPSCRLRPRPRLQHEGDYDADAWTHARLTGLDIDTLAKLAGDPFTPQAALTALAYLLPSHHLDQLAKNPSTPPDVLDMIARDHQDSGSAIHVIATHPLTPVATLVHLALTLPTEWTDRALVMRLYENPHTPAVVCDALARGVWPLTYAHGVTRNQRGVIRRLSEIDWWNHRTTTPIIQAAIAGHPSAPPAQRARKTPIIPADELAKMIRDAGTSQTALAKHLGVNKSVASNWVSRGILDADKAALVRDALADDSVLRSSADRVAARKKASAEGKWDGREFGRAVREAKWTFADLARALDRSAPTVQEWQTGGVPAEHVDRVRALLMQTPPPSRRGRPPRERDSG